MKYKEMFKSVFLVVLFSLSVYLAGNIVFKANFSGNVITEEKNIWIESNNNLIDYINPQSYVINFGGSLHSVIYNINDVSKLNSIVYKMLFEHLNNTKIEEINSNIWIDNILNKGIRFEFDFPIKISELLSVIKNEKVIVENDIEITEIFISSADGLFIRNKNKYYKNTIEELPLIDELIEDFSSYDVEYKAAENIYSLKKILAEDEEFLVNLTMMPTNKITGIPIVEVADEVNVNETNNINNYVSRVLGDDFVRKVVDYNGSIIYMVSYGEKALKIDIDGYFEYKQKSMISNNNIGFLKGFNKSINVLKTIDNLPNNFYLSNYYSYNNNEGISIVRYEFDYSFGGYQVELSKDNRAPFVVEFVGEDVVFIKRNYKKFIGAIDVDNIWDRAISINVILNKNFDLFLKNYFYSNNISLENNNNEFIYEILQNINSLSLKYYMQSSIDGDKLLPVWELEIDKIVYLINIYNGEVLSTQNKGILDEFIKN